MNVWRIQQNKIAIFGYQMDARQRQIEELCSTGVYGLYTCKINKYGKCRLYIDEPIVSIEMLDDNNDHLLRFSVNGVQTKGPSKRLDFGFEDPFPIDLVTATDAVEVWIDNFAQKKRKPRLQIITVCLTDDELDDLRSVTYSIPGWELRYCPWLPL